MMRPMAAMTRSGRLRSHCSKAAQPRIERMLKERSDVQQRYLKHQIDPEKHNLKHRGKHKITDAIAI
jgi:hypothetical protein